MFRSLESPAELSRISNLSSAIKAKRKYIADIIISNKNITNLNDLINLQLKEYERILEEAFTKGLEMISELDNVRSVEGLEKWTILKAVFFSSTVLTTIGE